MFTRLFEISHNGDLHTYFSVLLMEFRLYFSLDATHEVLPHSTTLELRLGISHVYDDHISVE